MTGLRSRGWGLAPSLFPTVPPAAGPGALPAARTALAAGPDGGLPLQAGRSAKFTTNKVTWMSLDVSPDGQQIVFDMLGDLYTLPISGGKATRITSGLAHDFGPRFSPD